MATADEIRESSRQYVVSAHDLRKLYGTMLRLYTENRMGGDEMRDHAQGLQSILDSAYELSGSQKTTDLDNPLPTV